MRRVNWAEVVEPGPSWAPETWRLWAVWPSPLDHDACFEAAGFDDFADTDDEWFAELETLTEGILTVLAGWGEPALVAGESPVEGGRVRPSIRDALVAAATDDNFRPCMVTFGEPAQAVVRTSNGHPLFWISLAHGDVDEILAIVRDHEVRERPLDWSKLF